MPNISTVDWPREFIENHFLPAIKRLRFRGRAHFFDEAGKTFVEQIEAGEKLVWPLRFAVEGHEKQKPRQRTQRRRPKSKKIL